MRRLLSGLPKKSYSGLPQDCCPRNFGSDTAITADESWNLAGAYVGLKKTPDWALELIGQDYPSIVAETGRTQTYTSLQGDLKSWTEGSDWSVPVIISVTYSRRTGGVLAARVEIFTVDKQLQAKTRVFNEDLFPIPNVLQPDPYISLQKSQHKHGVAPAYR